MVIKSKDNIISLKLAIDKSFKFSKAEHYSINSLANRMIESQIMTDNHSDEMSHGDKWYVITDARGVTRIIINKGKDTDLTKIHNHYAIAETADLGSAIRKIGGMGYDDQATIAFHGMNVIIESQENGRTSIRYIRKDIKAALTHFSTFNLDKKVYIRLLDISNNGAMIISDLKFSPNKKMALILQFDDRKRYMLPVTVVRRICSHSGVYKYGLKFRKKRASFGDYLLKTQTKLIFK